MKATGIVRRIDNLGRIVIPKEIRKTMRIREGDPLEIFIERDGEVILKKYSPFEELGTFAKHYAESISTAIPHTVCICDLDTVIASSGPKGKQFLGKSLHPIAQNAMEQRMQALHDKTDATFLPLTPEFPEEFISQAFVTIISEGDAIGCVCILSYETSLSETDLSIGKIAAGFLGKQME